MSLKDTVTEVMEDFNKRKNKLEIWETLEKKLKKAGFNYEYNQMITEADSFEAYEFLKVWDAIDEHLNKRMCKWGGNKEEYFKVMKALSKLDDIEEVIKTLAESGYELYYKDLGTYIRLLETNLKIFKTFAKDGLYKKYKSVFKALNKFGYKSINMFKEDRHVQLDYLISLARLEGDAVGAIYVLANNNYKIDEAGSLAELHIKNIKKITEEDEKERSEGKGGIPIYLYNTGNAELFQAYFNSLEIEKKKSVLKSILEYETKEDTKEQNNQIRDWLEKDYESLLREVGFEE